MKNAFAANRQPNNLFDFSAQGRKILPKAQLQERYRQIYDRYANAFESLHEQVKQKACRREYAKSDMFLGYYSPDALDLVMGGVHRGRLLQRVPQKSRYTHEYLFDDADHLICVYQYQYDAGERVLYTANILLHQPHRLLILCYSVRRDTWLEGIAECLYDGQKQIQFEEVICLANSCGMQAQTQWYEETENGAILYWWDRTEAPTSTLHLFDFSRDEQGFLSEYTAKAFAVDNDGGLSLRRDYNGVYHPTNQRKEFIPDIRGANDDG